MERNETTRRILVPTLLSILLAITVGNIDAGPPQAPRGTPEQIHTDIRKLTLELPGVVGPEIALYIARWSTLLTYSQQLEQARFLEQISDDLREVGSLLVFDRGTGACTRDTIMLLKKDIGTSLSGTEDNFLESAKAFRGIYVMMFAQSSVNIGSMKELSDKTPTNQEVQPQPALSLTSTNHQYGATLEPLGYFPPDSNFFQLNSLLPRKNLNEQVANKLPPPSIDAEDRKRLRKRFDEETKRMQSLSHLLAQMKLLQAALEHESAFRDYQQRISALHRDLISCTTSLLDRIPTMSNKDIANSRKAARDKKRRARKQLRDLRNALQPSLDLPVFIAALNSWHKGQDATVPDLKQTLAEMGIDIEIELLSRRPLWKHSRRMAQLEEKLAYLP